MGWLKFGKLQSKPDLLYTSPRGTSALRGGPLVPLRYLVLVWSVAVMSHEIDQRNFNPKYFTDWNFSFQILLYVLLSCQHLFTYMPFWLTAFTWVLFETVLANAVFLDIVYWALLYRPCRVITFVDFSLHALNGILMVIDLFLNAMPFEIGHMPFALGYAMVYVLMTIGLYEDQNFDMPYGFLDPGNRGAAGTYFGLMVALAVCYCAVWGLGAARTRARGASEDVSYCELFWCGPPSMFIRNRGGGAMKVVRGSIYPQTKTEASPLLSPPRVISAGGASAAAGPALTHARESSGSFQNVSTV